MEMVFYAQATVIFSFTPGLSSLRAIFSLALLMYSRVEILYASIIYIYQKTTSKNDVSYYIVCNNFQASEWKLHIFVDYVFY